MKRDILKERLLRKSLKELYELRGNQYPSKEAIIEDIIDNDDGSVAEMVEMEGSFFGLMIKKNLHQAMKEGV